MLQASNFDTFDTCRVKECLELVRWSDGHQEVVQLTIEVAMVFMALNGMPTGVSHSCSTGGIIFDDHVD